MAAKDRLFSVDEPANQSSEEDDDGLPVNHEVDTRIPAAPPGLKNTKTSEDKKFEEGFHEVIKSLKDRHQLKFVVGVSKPDKEGNFRCSFKFTCGSDSCEWDCVKDIEDFIKLKEKLQQDKSISGLTSSIPPLPQRRRGKQYSISGRQSKIEESTSMEKRELLLQFVRKMVTNMVFLEHPVMLATLEVPTLVCAKIDDFAKLYQTPLLASWLSKQGGKRKNWRNRWVVLYPDYTIRYYVRKDETSDAGKNYRGMIDLQALVRIEYYKKSKGHCFGLILKHWWEKDDHPRQYLFESKESQVRSIWMNGITKLMEGDLARYCPVFKESDIPLLDTRTAALEKERNTQVRLLVQLSELRTQNDDFKATDKKEQEEFEREQQKLEDDISELQPKLESATNALDAAKEWIKKTKREIEDKNEKYEDKFEEVESKILEESRKYNLRQLGDPIVPTRGRRRTYIENTAPQALGGHLDMVTKDSESDSRTCDVWFLQIAGTPYLEWADLSQETDTISATRMEISDVVEGLTAVRHQPSLKELGVRLSKRALNESGEKIPEWNVLSVDWRPSEDNKDEDCAFTVISVNRKKEVTFKTTSTKECQKWMRTLRNGLGFEDIHMDEDYKEETVDYESSLVTN
jgi:hypothetical protein